MAAMNRGWKHTVLLAALLLLQLIQSVRKHPLVHLEYVALLKGHA